VIVAKIFVDDDAGDVLSCRRCMITTMALWIGSLRRVGMASKNVATSLWRSASDDALSTLCGSSMITRSPRIPVSDVIAVAILKPPRLF
jgi:uncharacterized protein YcbX